MKKLYSLLLVFLFFQNSGSYAQNTTCNADFSFTIQNANQVHFVPAQPGDSINTVHLWTFGDGTNGSGISPTHTYNATGSYNAIHTIVRYTAGIPSCTNTVTRTIVINSTCNLVANFIKSVTATGSFQFTNTSTPTNQNDSVRWTFGDGSSSNVFNPDHSYSAPGVYNVCLRMQQRNSAGVLTDCVREKCDTVHVTPSSTTCNLSVSFWYAIDTMHTGNFRDVQFFNTSAPAALNDSIRWTFGDGSNSNVRNPQHIYAQNGTYEVCLRIIKRNANGSLSDCARYICQQVVITGSCNLHASFTHSVDISNPKKIHFTNTTIIPNTNASALWHFGDGTTSATWNAVHEYATAGRYLVCLRVESGPNCVSEKCDSITVTNSFNCSDIHVSYTAVRDSAVPNKYHFYAFSNVPIVHQTWTILKYPFTGTPVILQQNNPVYTFQDTGYYRVCLRAEFPNSCIKEYCNYIHVEHINLPSGCTFYPYPNPAHTEVHANVHLGSPQVIRTYIYNSANVLVRQSVMNGVVGNNVVTVGIGDLVAGIYTMKIVHNNDVCSAHFVKL